MKVLVMRNSLPLSELDRISKEYFDGKAVFIFSSPQSEAEWHKECERFNPDFVLLPGELPLLTKAIEAGYKHVVLTPQGLMELVRVV